MTGTPPVSEVVPDALDGERLDRLVAICADCSRADAQRLIRSGGVTISGNVLLKPAHRVRTGDRVELVVPPGPTSGSPEPDPAVDVPVVFADDQVIVVDKPAGLVVHPGPGHDGGTLVNGLLARFAELAEVGDPGRPGLVHRIDRGTSGLLVVARTPEAYVDLVGQLADHGVERTYTALVWRHLDHPRGVIDAPIGRSRRNPLRMTVSAEGRPARTLYRVDRELREPAQVSLLTCELETGRTHQIRVHLASTGHPVVGDELYGGARPPLDLPRPFLHARRLGFTHPGTGEHVELGSPLPPDLVEVVDSLS